MNKILNANIYKRPQKILLLGHKQYFEHPMIHNLLQYHFHPMIMNK